MNRLQSADSRRNIKLDYSDTYLENEELENELDNKVRGLQKAKYKASIDRDENLERARREAEEIQKLSEAVKKHGPREDYLKESSNKLFDSSNVREDVSMNILNSTHDSIDPTGDSDDEKEDVVRLKPVNIAMFKLNIRNFKRKMTEAKGHDAFGIGSFSGLTRKSQSAQTSFSTSRRRPDVPPPMFLRPRTAIKQRKVKDGEVLEAMDIQPIVIQGVHTRKFHSTRSRRELQEISKIQQEEKFGKPDRKAEERKKVAAWAKGDGKLELRIKKFLHDVEEFKRRGRKSEFPLLQMMRSSSVAF